MFEPYLAICETEIHSLTFMDKPLGPRQPPPDKRHAAYESIFGRPHQSYNSPLNPDRRSSINSPFSPSPSLYPHAPYPTQPPLHYYSSSGPSHNSLPNYVQPPYPSYPSSFLPDNSPLNSPPPPPHDPVPFPGLTTAQSYQAQPYVISPSANSNPSAPPRDWPRSSPGPSDRRSHPPPNGGPSRLPDPPKLGISLEHDDGRLGIDFVERDEDDSLDIGQDESGSELPWAQIEHNGTHLSLYLHSTPHSSISSSIPTVSSATTHF